MPKCKYCQKDFNRARDTKIYCSDKCRLYSFRGLSVTGNSTKSDDISVTDTLSVTQPQSEAKKEPDSVTDSVTPEEISVTDELNYDNSYEKTPAEFFNPEF